MYCPRATFGDRGINLLPLYCTCLTSIEKSSLVYHRSREISVKYLSQSTTVQMSSTGVKLATSRSLVQSANHMHHVVVFNCSLIFIVQNLLIRRTFIRIYLSDFQQNIFCNVKNMSYLRIHKDYQNIRQDSCIDILEKRQNHISQHPNKVTAGRDLKITQ